MDAKQKGDNKTSGKPAGAQGGTPEQHAQAGRQRHKNDANRQSGDAGAGFTSGTTAGGGSGMGEASGGRSASSGSVSATRGATPEQHAEAGRQRHKNDGTK